MIFIQKPIKNDSKLLAKKIKSMNTQKRQFGRNGNQKKTDFINN